MSETARIKPTFEITTEQKLADLALKITELQSSYMALENQAVTSLDSTDIRKMVVDEIARQTRTSGLLHLSILR